MKKVIYTFLILTAASVFCFENSFAGNAKSNAKYEINKGIKLQKKIEGDRKLAQFYPHIEYNKGYNHLNEAIHQFKEESEYELASYYAVMALVELETARTIAETRYYRHRTLEREITFYKNKAKRQMLKAAILAANLEKKGKAYQGMVEDRDLFIRRSFRLDNKAKRNILDKVLDVVKLYPESKIIIKGHTRYRDRNNSRSMQKAKAVAEYFTIEKGLDEKRITIEGMGNTQPVMVKRGRRTYPRTKDRVELVITDVSD